jgi:hypothetical protein
LCAHFSELENVVADRIAPRFETWPSGNVRLVATLATLLSQIDVRVRGYDNELVIAGIVSIALGVLIFFVPRLLNYVVAAYLVVIGVIWLIAGL